MDSNSSRRLRVSTRANLDDAIHDHSAHSHPARYTEYSGKKNLQTSRNSLTQVVPQSKIQKLSSSSYQKSVQRATKRFEPMTLSSPPRTVQTHLETPIQVQSSGSVREYQLPMSTLVKKKPTRESSDPRIFRPQINASQTHERKSLPGQSYIAGSKSRRSTRNFTATPSPAYLNLPEKPTSKTQRSTFRSRNSIKNYLIEQPQIKPSPEISRGASDSDDPLTSLGPGTHFYAKPPPQKRKIRSCSLSPDASSTLRYPSRVRKNTPKTATKSIPIIILDSSPRQSPPKEVECSLSPPPVQSSPHSTKKDQKSLERFPVVELETLVEANSEPEITTSSENKARHRHIDVPVPDPVYYPFKCEWKGCKAELMNMDILRKHVYVTHAKKLEGGGRRCLWRRCGDAWEAPKRSQGSTKRNNSRRKRSYQELKVIYNTRQEWKKHIEEHHMIPFSWHMGDGPRGSQLAQPSTAWEQPHLFNADGVQTTPSVASQRIEVGQASKLNARRFRWCYGGGLFGDDVLVPLSRARDAARATRVVDDEAEGTPAQEETHAMFQDTGVDADTDADEMGPSALSRSRVMKPRRRPGRPQTRGQELAPSTTGSEGASSSRYLHGFTKESPVTPRSIAGCSEEPGNTANKHLLCT